MDGAGRGNRTLTLSPELDFESSASTNSAIPAFECAGSAKRQRCPREMESALSRKILAPAMTARGRFMSDPTYRLSDFDYDLPPELIAQVPVPARASSRLMHVAGATIADRSFADLPTLIAPGDLLVFNDTKVMHSRL